jgi:hypothetical protein
MLYRTLQAKWTKHNHNREILAQSLSTQGAVFRINPFGLDDAGDFADLSPRPIVYRLSRLE